ncbi:hypothetical protein GR254_21350 [Mycobacterium tuberculosis]|nr:hypothetical protein [Mycobacterium tuberculosis]
MNRWVATRSRRHTYQWITDHKSPRDHYRHISELRTSIATSSPGRCDMSPIPRIVSVSLAWAAMIRGLRRTHGWPAAMGILREMGMAHHRKWHKSFPLTCPASC